MASYAYPTAPTYRGNPRRLCRTPRPGLRGGDFFLSLHGTYAPCRGISKHLWCGDTRRTGENHAEPAGTNPEMAPEKFRRLRHSPPRFRGGNIFFRANILEQISIGIHPVSEFRDKIGFTRLTYPHYTHYRWKNQADFRVLAAFSQLFRLN